MQNPFIWHDLMTTNVEAAKKFYGAVIGWTFTSQMQDYTVANVDGIGMGGIMATPPEMKAMPPVWNGYVFTSDVDAASAQAVKLGGKIYRSAWDIPEVGRMAVIGDPSGAAFIVMQPFSTQQQPEPKFGTVGTVGWNELHAGDLSTAWEFYSKLFGWTKGDAHDMGPMGTYQLFQIDGKDVGGMMKKMDSTPLATWTYYFNVDGINAAAARITEAGGKVVMGPHQVPGGNWIVSGVDPQGASFSLTSLS